MDFHSRMCEKTLSQLKFGSRKSINKSNPNQTLVVGMECMMCGANIGFEFRSGIYRTGICLVCGETRNRIRLV